MDDTDLSGRLSQNLNLPIANVETMLAGFAEILKEKSENMISVAIPGFGNFLPVKHSEKIVVDVKSGKRYLEPPCVKLEFVASAILKQKIAEKGNGDE